MDLNSTAMPDIASLNVAAKNSMKVSGKLLLKFICNVLKGPRIARNTVFGINSQMQIIISLVIVLPLIHHSFQKDKA